MQAACRVALRYVLLVDRAVHLLDHLEILMDGVAGEGIERHRRAGHLEWPRRQVVDIRDARIRTQREAQTRAAGGEQKLILRRQARVAAGNAEDRQIGRDRANAGHIGRRQRRVELLLRQVRAAEEFPAIGGGHDLVLMRLGEIRTRRAVGIDDALGQQVQHALVPVFGT